MDMQVRPDGLVRLYIGLGNSGRLPGVASGTITSCPGGAFLDLDPGRTEAVLDGHGVSVEATAPETGILAGRNVLMGLRHGESAEVVASWLEYHVREHGADAALILDRSAPEDATGYLEDLTRLAGRCAGLECLLVVTTSVPLGRASQPSLTHPVHAPAAPGKPRMTLPSPDLWLSPLDDTLVFEALHRRFLSQARAVLNLDVCDLLLPSGAERVFDQCLLHRGQYISLTGREVYPWRLRKGQAPTFGDHICTQFDQAAQRRRWAISPKDAPDAIWRMTRIVGPAAVEAGFNLVRCMAIRHPGVAVSALVPKSGLVEDDTLIALARDRFGHDPVRAPQVELRRREGGAGHTTIVTCMKDEGPFILEWIAYHRAIGIDRYLVYTNDCSDGTDKMLDLLQARGLVTHRDNPYRESGLKPQHAALQAAEAEDLVDTADWLICMDVDEFLNIHAGEGRIQDLYAAAGEANMISATWRLFGNGDISAFSDQSVLEQFTRCAPELAPKPHQAWGFKTLFRHIGCFRKLGVHRPKGLVPQLKDKILWVNGSGQPMPETALRTAWRSTTDTYGYGLVTLNHYACRSAESFLVKRDRGRVNHVGRDQGLKYWFRMNNNAVEDRSIQRMLPSMRAELNRLLADPEIAAAHAASVAQHRAKVSDLRARADYAAFFGELTTDRMRRLSRLHAHFGSGVFWSGPEVVPDEILARDPDDDFFFTVEPTGSGH